MSVEFIAKRLASKFTSNLYDEDDLAQDAYLARIKHPRQLAHQSMIDSLRRFYGRSGKSSEFRRMVNIDSVDSPYDPNLDRQVLLSELSHYMTNLTYHQWLVSNLYYFYGYRGLEIARITNISYTAVIYLLYESRVELRRMCGVHSKNERSYAA